MITNTTNSVFSGMRFVQSQFWTMAITHSEDVLLENIYVNSTSSNSVKLFTFASPSQLGADKVSNRALPKIPTAVTHSILTASPFEIGPSPVGMTTYRPKLILQTS